jgi:RimJ/RimL family protein N-acetyltransferase
MIVTLRLVLRPWRPSDLEPFAAQNGDPEVMRFLDGVLTRGESDAYAARCEQHFAEVGYCK